MSALQHHQLKGTYERGVVACRKCLHPIHIFRINAIADEFSVPCNRCGHRGMFRNREIAVETLPERRRKPRAEQRR